MLKGLISLIHEERSKKSKRWKELHRKLELLEGESSLESLPILHYPLFFLLQLLDILSWKYILLYLLHQKCSEKKYLILAMMIKSID